MESGARVPAFIRGFQKSSGRPTRLMCLIGPIPCRQVDEIKKFPMRKFFFDLESLQYQQGEQPEQCLRPNDPRDRQAICHRRL